MTIHPLIATYLTELCEGVTNVTDAAKYFSPILNTNAPKRKSKKLCRVFSSRNSRKSCLDVLHLFYIDGYNYREEARLRHSINRSLMDESEGNLNLVEYNILLKMNQLHLNELIELYEPSYKQYVKDIVELCRMQLVLQSKFFSTLPREHMYPMQILTQVAAKRIK